jgi:hypothetical protein
MAYNPYSGSDLSTQEAMVASQQASIDAAQLAAYGQISSQNETARPDLIKWILEGKDVLVELRHKLLGEVEVEKGEWKKIQGRRIMNETGVNEVMSFLEMIVTKEATTTILPEEDILLITRKLGHAFNRLICANQEKYEISMDKLELAVLSILHCVKVALMRSKDGKMLQMIQTVERRQEVYTEKPEKKEGGIFGLFGRKR